MSIRLGGFVIFGNSAPTLAACIQSLQTVCDDVVGVDSESNDGSADIAHAYAIKRIVHPWRGYGAARAVAAQALQHCDYLFFLDSDETLAPGSVEKIQQWRDANPTLPQYTVQRRDWAELAQRRFLFRQETKKRFLRRDSATWRDSMIVHESQPKLERAATGVQVDHRFATSTDVIIEKQLTYAFLWAVQAYGEGRKGKQIFGRRSMHFLRNTLSKGAAFRGGIDALKLSWAVANYHQAKYRYLRALEQGAFPEAVQAWREQRYQDLFVLLENKVHLQLV